MPRIQCDCISTVDIHGDCFIGFIRVSLIIQSRLTDSAVSSSVVHTYIDCIRGVIVVYAVLPEIGLISIAATDIGVSPVLSELTLTQAPSSVSTGSKP
mgnify:CR=1 FL=1